MGESGMSETLLILGDLGSRAGARAMSSNVLLCPTCSCPPGWG